MTPILALIAALALGALQVSGFYSDIDTIKVIEKDLFSELKHKNELQIVEFYADWCGHCKAFTPTYIALSQFFSATFKDAVSFKAVSCVSSRDVCNRFDITGYPTLKIAQPNTNALVSDDALDGSRSFNSVALWILEELKKYNVTAERYAHLLQIKTQADLKKHDYALGFSLKNINDFVDFAAFKAPFLGTKPQIFIDRSTKQDTATIYQRGVAIQNLKDSDAGLANDAARAIAQNLDVFAWRDVLLFLYHFLSGDFSNHIKIMTPQKIHTIHFLFAALVSMYPHHLRKTDSLLYTQPTPNFNHEEFRIRIEGGIYKNDPYHFLSDVLVLISQIQAATLINPDVATTESTKALFTLLSNSTKIAFGISLDELSAVSSNVAFYPNNVWKLFHYFSLNCETSGPTANDRDASLQQHPMVCGGNLLHEFYQFIKHFFGCMGCVRDFEKYFYHYGQHGNQVLDRLDPEARESDFSGLKIAQILSLDASSASLWLWEAHNSVSRKVKEDPHFYFPQSFQCGDCTYTPPAQNLSTSWSFLNPLVADTSMHWHFENTLSYLKSKYDAKTVVYERSWIDFDNHHKNAEPEKKQPAPAYSSRFFSLDPQIDDVFKYLVIAAFVIVIVLLIVAKNRFF